MAELTIRTPSAIDAIDSLCKVAEKLFESTSVTLSISTDLPGYSLSATANGSELAKNAEVVKVRDDLCSLPIVPECRSFTLAQSKPSSRRLQFDRDPKEFLFGTLKLESLDKEQKTASQLVATEFRLRSHSTLVDASLPAHVQQHLKAREETLGDLTDTVKKLELLAAQQVERNEEFMRQMRQRMENEFQERRKALEEEHSAREAELRKREDDHNAKVRDFDTRDSKYVRRHLLERMQGQIEERKEIRLSPSTTRKRRPIHVLCAALLMLSATGIISLLLTMPYQDAIAWHQVTPLAALILIFGSTAVYYLRWNHQWFHEHAKAEFQNIRLAADILRASWVAELVFDWEREKQQGLPKELLERFTANLFTDGQYPSPEHPNVQLAALISRVSRLRLGKGLVEVERRPEQNP